MRNARFRILRLAILTCAVLVMPAAPGTIRAALKTPGDRTAGPAFGLRDASGRTVRLADYRGKVLLLNFWATECGGCRLEIPWLAEIGQIYKNKRVAVVGISMDISYEDLKGAAEAWTIVNPFVQAHQIRYPILMGDTDVMKRYDIQALPVTYLIDRSGRIAATYIGLVDKQNVEANINTLLTER
jgi:peroxiredoxin